MFALSFLYLLLVFFLTNFALMNEEFYKFAWATLTPQQQFRAKVKFDLFTRLNQMPKNKRIVYRFIAEKYNYSLPRVEWIANHKL